ncbi:MAG: sulfurtransferase [Chromatiales bacterium]|nr:sulfurtransferase [Chromatiales bacterium]
MNAAARFPLIVDPADLESRLHEPDLLIVDLCKPEIYAQLHVPGAVHVNYPEIVAMRPPVMGLLPPAEQVHALCGRLGIGPDTHVVAYDDEGGGRAGRLLWTLAAWGHTRLSLLDGCLHAWANEGHLLDRAPAGATPTDFTPRFVEDEIADRTWILAHLDDPGVCLLDTRSAGEYAGTDKRAERAGHIPGAVHFEWTRAMDTARNLRLRPRDALLEELATLGVTPEREVVVYCHSHHRSAHTWVMLKHLGFRRVRGYPGSWSDWGNAPDTPIEV